MPELPEVETIADDLRNSGIIGCEVVKVDIYFPKAVVGSLATLKGKTISSITRRGKFVVFQISDGRTLFVHLRMSGQLTTTAAETPPEKHEHVILSFNSGIQLRFRDPRKFGRWYLVEDAAAFTEKLGPEPLSQEFNLADFKKKLTRKKRQIKPLLLDQSFLAGLGNIYVDEALWEAKIHPETLCCHLKDDEAEGLFSAIRFVLERGLSTKGTTLRNYARPDGASGQHQTLLSVFRRTGKPCPRCRTAIQRIVVAQRSSHFCPTCQKCFSI